MSNEFLQVKNGEFVKNKKSIILRGFNIGSWMDIEDFMIKIPGSDKSIRKAYTEVYGKEHANQFFEDYLSNLISEEDFILLKDLGINVLRLPFSYRHFENDQEPGKILQEGFQHIDRVLELCRKYQIYAILDMHSAPNGQNPASHGGGETGISGFWEDAFQRDRIIHLWEVIAKKYKDDDIIAGYDILNEPSFVSDVDAFNDFYEKVILKIREVDENHILFLEGDDWAKDFSIFNKLEGYQLAISFHFYPGQHVSMSMEREERKKELKRKIKYFTDLRDKTGMPLWVGETGGHFPPSQLLEGIELIKDCIDIFEQNRISWTIWSYKDARAMGMIYPQEDTAWMTMVNDLRLVWERKDRGYSSITEEIFKMLELKFSYLIEDKLKEKLSFQISSLLGELHYHKLVKPTLEKIPWEEMKEYPKSFLLPNCEGSEELAKLVSSYTKSEY